MPRNASFWSKETACLRRKRRKKLNHSERLPSWICRTEKMLFVVSYNLNAVRTRLKRVAKRREELFADELLFRGRILKHMKFALRFSCLLLVPSVLWWVVRMLKLAGNVINEKKLSVLPWPFENLKELCSIKSTNSN